jgi:hypothetical protein
MRQFKNFGSENVSVGGPIILTGIKIIGNEGCYGEFW